MRSKLISLFAASTLTAVAVLAVACGTQPADPDAGTNTGTDGGHDSGTNSQTDAGATDAGTTDAGTTDAGTTDAGTNDAGTTDGGPTGCTPVYCGGQIYECANCIDDDGDGLVDAVDTDCLGACHNDESSFDIGIQAAKGGNCDSLECYYDTNAGRGNDDCKSSFKCDPLTPYPSCSGVTYPNANYCPATQSAMCLDTCQRITPNGCDCFGCCTVTKPDGTTRDIFLGSEDITGINCALEDVDNPAACRSCTKNPSCEKECGRCQLCIGKTTVPEDCLDAGVIILPDGGTEPVDAGNLQCPGGEQPCGLPGQAACAVGFYCLTGCCVEGLN